MNFNNLHKYILGILLMISIVGCVKEADLEIEKITKNPQENDIRVTFTTKPEKTITKSVDENQINNINLFVFNSSGDLLSQKYLTSASGTITVSSGNRTIVGIANVGQTDFSNINSFSTLTNFFCTEYKDATNNLIMVGYISQNLQKGGSVHVELSRLAAKISIAFDKSLMGSGGALADRNSVKITKIELKNVPAKCKYLINNTINSSSDITGGEYIESINDLSETDGLFNDLYMFENIQGNIGSAVSEKDKNPGSKSNVCTYVEITASYSSPVNIGTVKYKFYLGSNITNNFDVSRNTNYRITVRFTNNGGINENSWRVETENLYDVFYNITAASSPTVGGSILGSGQYKYGQMPDLIAVPNTNYIFNGWSPPLNTVTGNQLYIAIFEYNSPIIHVSSITLPSSLELDEGEISTLSANILPINATNQTLSWSSSNPSVASVDNNGNISAISNGTSTISATCQDGGITANCVVTVYKIVDIFFDVKKVIKMTNNDVDEMRDDIYVRATGGSGASVSLSYTITGPPDDAGTGEVVSGNINEQISSSLNTKIDWIDIVTDNENIAFSIISISGLTPAIISSPPTKFRINQSLNTYTTQIL